MGAKLSNVKNVMVVGASGNVGSSVLEHLISLKSDKTTIIAGVRDPAKLQGKFEGVKTVALTMGAEGAADVFTAESVQCLVIVTPGTRERAELVEATLGAAKKAKSIKHVVVISFSNAETTAEIFGEQAAAIEKATKASGLPYTIVRLPVFMDNDLAHAGSIAGQGQMYCPVDPEKQFVAISVKDIGEAMAQIALLPKRFKNKTVHLINKAHSYNDFIAAVKTSTGKDVTYVRVSYEDAKKSILETSGMPEWQVDGVLQLFKAIDEGRYVYEQDVPTFRLITRHDPETVVQWVERNKAAFGGQ